MNPPDLYRALLAANNVAGVEEALRQFEDAQTEAACWVPLGGRENNQGTVGAASDSGRSLVERLTNGVDAVMEDEYERHQGRPVCRSPREAAAAWLNVPDGGLSEMGQAQRRALAQRVTVRVGPGDGKESRILEIRDRGIGLTPIQMPSTILSLNASNKMKKHHLVGVFGQGGSSTFAVSKYTLIASRREGNPTVGFSVVCFKDVPPGEEDKIGHYAYLTSNGGVMQVELPIEDFPTGTLVRHYGYDLSDYAAKIGPTSVYGLLSQALFDPVLPVWLDDHEIHNIRRVIKGARNALNGAVDEGDEERRGPTVPYNEPLYHVSLGEYGRMGIEYWVLDRPTRTNKTPTRAFVNPAKPIILTQNGQSHGELSVGLTKKNAELPFLAQRLICHINCDSLTSLAKRLLFVTNREDARRGQVLNLIQQELVKALTSDDELKRLNDEAKEQGYRERDEATVQEMQREVARLLRLQGIDLDEAAGAEAADTQQVTGRFTQTARRRPSRPQPISISEPPTFIRIVWPEEEDITFHRDQRRYIRIETDANSNYFNPDDPLASRINIVRPAGGIRYCGSSPLRGGRMRAVFEGVANAHAGAAGVIRIELARPGLPVLEDERNFRIVEPPPEKPSRGRVTVPKFGWRQVEGPESELWNTLGWPEDPATVASEAQMENGQLVISYSTVFPRYAQQLGTLERRDTALAISFTRRYEIWLAVHSWLLHRDEQAVLVSAGPTPRTQSDTELAHAEAWDRQERCRIATLAVLFAAREIETPAMMPLEIE